MDRYEIYFKLREFCCKSPYCSICQISFINPQHKCGNGYGYFLDGNPVPLLEALKYYSIIYGEHNLRNTIEKRKENYRHEGRI